jgi:hypothetical protein
VTGCGRASNAGAARSADGTWQTASPARLVEARCLLARLGEHGGHIDIGDPRFAFRWVSLPRRPANWLAAARGSVTAWRPVAYSGQD